MYYFMSTWFGEMLTDSVL